MKIRYKLLFIIISTVLITILPISMIAIDRSEAIIVKNTYSICNNLSESISNIAREELFLNKTYEGTQKIVLGLNATNFQGLFNVFIINIEGKYVVDFKNELVGKTISESELQYIQSIDKLSYKEIVLGTSKFLRFTYPIFLDNDEHNLKIGATIFDFDTNLLFSPVIQIRSQIQIFSIGILIASIFIGIIFSFFFTRPIHLLSRGVSIIRQGNLDYRIALKSSDEIGKLAIEFNEMTAKIQEANQELKGLNEGLEIKVQERTLELSKAREQAEVEKGIAVVAQLEAEKEREKSEKLLLNILPVEIVQELKEKGHTEPVLYEAVSVLFTDFKGFTKIAEKLTPQELVKELDNCFIQFDKIIDRFNLEKLKTIGDSYMVAGGIPKANKTNAIEAVLAAIEIQEFMAEMKSIKEILGLPYWELRLGIHTGPLIAGVIGEKKFAYDVWGDTVNTASRLESSGTPGKVNVSRATYEKIKDFFICEYRGRINAKNKGEIDMFFVNSIKPEFSANKIGTTPNQKLLDIIAQL